FAVMVWFVDGVVMVWLRAPPSDHPVKSYVLLPPGMVKGAAITRSTPTTLVNVCGALTVGPSRVRLAPEGVEASVKVTIRGWTSLNVVAVCPAESVTVRWTR